MISTPEQNTLYALLHTVPNRSTFSCIPIMYKSVPKGIPSNQSDRFPLYFLVLIVLFCFFCRWSKLDVRTLCPIFKSCFWDLIYWAPCSGHWWKSLYLSLTKFQNCYRWYFILFKVETKQRQKCGYFILFLTSLQLSNYFSLIQLESSDRELLSQNCYRWYFRL